MDGRARTGDAGVRWLRSRGLNNSASHPDCIFSEPVWLAHRVSINHNAARPAATSKRPRVAAYTAASTDT
jgi:hypothetical protein